MVETSLAMKKISVNNYEFLKTLGVGSFGRVRISKNLSTGKFVAMKICKKVQIVKLKQVDHMNNELRILSYMNHPFIANFEGWNQDNRYIQIMLELIQGGEMFSHLRGVGRYTDFQSKFQASQIGSIFKFMHLKNVAQRDLKPENILIGKDGYLKLVDFGFAKVITSKSYTVCGTPEYLAPEIINKIGHDKSVDWWALGILIQEMLTGLDPFTDLSDDNPMGIYKRILGGKIRFPKSFPKDGRDLIKNLVTEDLTKRQGNLKNGANDVLKHPWFSGIDQEALLMKSIEAPYIPKIGSESDTKNQEDYPESTESCPSMDPKDDPFFKW